MLERCLGAERSRKLRRAIRHSKVTILCLVLTVVVLRGTIGAGKFGSMFLAMAARSPGLLVAGIADLSVPRARAALARVGWQEEKYGAASLEQALRDGTTALSEDSMALIADPRIEVVIECTGNPAAGIRHALAAIDHGKHVVMVNVEADALAGPLLAARARAALAAAAS